MPKRPKAPMFPAIVPGEWQVELLGGGSVHLGGAINMTPEPHAIEFSFVTVPALALGPGKIELAAVVVLMCPAESIVNEHPGHFMQNGPMTMIDLSPTRALFSDLLRGLEDAKFERLEFKAEEGAKGGLPISSWSFTYPLPNR